MKAKQWRLSFSPVQAGSRPYAIAILDRSCDEVCDNPRRFGNIATTIQSMIHESEQ
jgi:hypothetical protein